MRKYANRYFLFKTIIIEPVWWNLYEDILVGFEIL